MLLYLYLTFLIENQPTLRNPKMKAISSTIYDYYLIRGIFDKDRTNSNIKLVKYEIDMKKIMSPGGTTVGLANGMVLADDKKIYSADNLKVGLFK